MRQKYAECAASFVTLILVQISLGADVPFARVAINNSIDIATSEMHQGEDPDEVVVWTHRNHAAAWDKLVLSTQGSHCIQAGDIGADGDLDLMGANWSGPFQPVEPWENRSGVGAWQGDYEYRVPVRVGAAGFNREGVAVEVPLDLAELLTQLGRTAPGGNPEIRVVEVDASGRVTHEVVPVQFIKDPNSQAALRGTLTFMLWQPTPAQAERVFHVYFGFKPQATMTDIEPPHVYVDDNIDHEGQRSFKISTPTATYYYHKRGAGFASIEDRDGNDWLSYNPGDGPVSKSGSGGKYRGIPNMVHPEGHFHPGGENCTSRLVTPGPAQATIVSESDDGAWACRWDIFPLYARMTVLKAGHPYWFLYEGTPGGKLDEESDYCVRCDGTRTAAGIRWEGDIPGGAGAGEWLYFGDSRINRVLYLVHHEDDGEIDSYRPMNHEMTVFGFGRKDLAKHMIQTPSRFTLGFCEHGDFSAVSRAVESACRPVAITIGSPEARK
jgi:hypothetical protein